MDYEDIKGMNWSSLKEMNRCPLMYAWRRDHPRKDTAALLLGRAEHCAVFEPAEFWRRYVVGEAKACAATTKKGTPCTHSALPLVDHCGVHGGQDEAAAWSADHPGVEVITAGQGETLEQVGAAIRRHLDAAALLQGTHAEQVITWTDPETGILCKGRLDTFDRRRVVDLKTTRDLLRFVKWDFEGFLYHGQLAWYLDGGIAAGVLDENARAYVVAAETNEPFDVGAFELAGADLEAGRSLYRRLLNEWASCRDTDDWYGMFPKLTRIELSRRALADAEAVTEEGGF